MTLSASTFNCTAALVLGGLLVAPLFVGSAHAGVTKDLLRCKFDNRQKTVNCCEQALDRKKMPLWMHASNGNCSAVVRCVEGKSPIHSITYVAKPRCYVEIPYDDNQGTGNTPTAKTNRFTKD